MGAASHFFLPSRKVNAFEEQPNGQQQRSGHHQRQKPAKLILRREHRREIADDERQTSYRHQNAEELREITRLKHEVASQDPPQAVEDSEYHRAQSKQVERQERKSI